MEQDTAVKMVEALNRIEAAIREVTLKLESLKNVVNAKLK